MHYLFVHAAKEWSGTARVFTTAARALAERGHVVTFAVEPESEVEQIISQASVKESGKPIFYVEPCSFQGSRTRAAFRLRRLARSRGAEVVFVHTDREQLIAALAYRYGSRAPVVRRVPDGNMMSVHRSGRMAASIAPTCFTFASERDLRATILPRGTTALVVTLGVREVTPDVFAQHVNEIGSGGKYIVCIHDASARSRAASAIRTVAMLAPRHPDLQLVITGEGGYEDDLRMQAAALGILHLVSFLGDRADELDVVRGATLGWVVAESDTAAYGILDCMSLGVPVLGGEGTVAERYILSDITGMLVPSDDAYTTAACVVGLLSNERQRTMMGDAARTRVGREFPEGKMVDGFERAADAVARRR